jgi:hypothetical protein
MWEKRRISQRKQRLYSYISPQHTIENKNNIIEKKNKIEEKEKRKEEPPRYELFS